jgi:hypothetical protein
MPTPSGQISLNDVNVELGLAGTTTISMNQANVRALAGVPSGAISMQNLQNKSNRVTITTTIAANTVNYTVSTDKASGYIAGKTDFILNINSGVFVSSSTTGTAAMIVNTSWNAADTVRINNSGTIIGRGGNGGAGAYFAAGGTGGGGGLGLLVQRATSVNNLNRISGGGGGGGGGGSASTGPSTVGGGGGGGGIGVSSAGPAGFSASSGAAGTLTTAGGGGAGTGTSFTTNDDQPVTFFAQSGSGGGGGTFGSAGSAGQPGGYRAAGGAGAAGAAVSGNANITWINFGTRNGAVA